MARAKLNLAAAASSGLDWDRIDPSHEERMKRATYEDVLNAPENKVAEILDGELFLTPRPGYRHARAQAAVHGLLWGRFDSGHGGPEGLVAARGAGASLRRAHGRSGYRRLAA